MSPEATHKYLSRTPYKCQVLGPIGLIDSINDVHGIGRLALGGTNNATAPAIDFRMPLLKLKPNGTLASVEPHFEILSDNKQGNAGQLNCSWQNKKTLVDRLGNVSEICPSRCVELVSLQTKFHGPSDYLVLDSTSTNSYQRKQQAGHSIYLNVEVYDKGNAELSANLLRGDLQMSIRFESTKKPVDCVVRYRFKLQWSSGDRAACVSSALGMDELLKPLLSRPTGAIGVPLKKLGSWDQCAKLPAAAAYVGKLLAQDTLPNADLN